MAANIVIILIIVLLLLLLSAVWPPDSPWAPWWKTSKKVSEAVIKLAGITKKDIVYELGSGDGTLLLTIANNKHAKVVGIEIDPLRHCISLLKVWFQKQKNVSLIRKNFNEILITPATVVFVYLVPRALSRLKPKLKKELQKGAKVVSYRYQFPLSKKETFLKFVKEDKKHQLYLYEKV